MSTIIQYKGSTLATVSNQTKTLKTAGKYMEGDVSITDTKIYTATISGTGNINYCYVRLNNTTKYYTTNDTFQFKEGDSLYCYGYYSGGQFYIEVNSQAVTSIGSSASYTYTMPAKDIQISLQYSAQGMISILESVIPTAGYWNGQTITPSTNTQTIFSTNRYYTGNITVNPIPSQYIIPSGTLSITENGTKDVTNYASVSVNVSSGSTINNQDKTVSPTESTQYVTADEDYTGLGTVTVNAISSTYVGSEITQRSSTDLTASGATVSVPAGYYSTAASKSIANGSASAPTSISGSTATVSTGTNTLTLTKTVSITPVVSAGYISSGTATNSSVSLTASVTTKAAATITPGTTNQTIAAGTYLTGTQTIAGDADLVGSNIISTANIFGTQGTVVIQKYYTGANAPSSSLGNNGDIYLQE